MNMTENNLISIIIVNYNADKYLSDCVTSLLSSKQAIEIFISDNGSTDNSIEWLKANYGHDPRIHIIENGKNTGFSLGNNIAIPFTRGNYLLFLNPDCTVEPETLSRVKQVMDENPQAGMAGCLIRNSDHTIQPTCVRGMPTPWNSLVRVLHLSKWFGKSRYFKGVDLAQVELPKEITAVTAISGAFMFVRRQALLDVGLLDEKYFLYVEDLDWMMRFSQRGWKILFVPDVEITHVKGACGQARPFMVLWHKHKGMMRFYQKFFRQQYSLFVMGAVYAAIWTRFLILASISMLKRLIYSKA